MNLFLIHLIGLYRKYLRHRFRGKCIFEISCSEAVLQSLIANGTTAGLSTLTDRMKKCRSGYVVTNQIGTDGYNLVLLRNGDVVSASVLRKTDNETQKLSL